MEVKQISNLFEELQNYLSKYVDDSILISYNYLCNFVEVLKSNASDNEENIIHAYKVLYPGIGGLSDFLIKMNRRHRYDTKTFNRPMERRRKFYNDI